MFRAVDVKAVKEYISPNDPDKENPTKWQIGVIDTVLRGYLTSKVSSSVVNDKAKDGNRTVHVNPIEFGRLMVKYGLRGVENFYNSAGTEQLKIEIGVHNINGVAYPAMKDSDINLIPKELIEELSVAIDEYQGLNEEQVKN